MKSILLLSLLFIASSVKAQLQPLTSGVYSVDSITAKIDTATKKKAKLEGSTTDLKNLNAHSSTLAPGKTNHPSRALNDREEIVIVKEGQLTLVIKDSAKTIGAGGIAFIEAGDAQSFQNNSAMPVTYYVLGFTSTNSVDLTRGKDGGSSIVMDWKDLPVTKKTVGESRPAFDKASAMFTRFEVHATTLNGLQESHAPHTHKAEEIMFLIKGVATVKMGEEKLNASAGSMILARPDVLHNVTNASTEPCMYYAIKWYN